MKKLDAHATSSFGVILAFLLVVTISVFISPAQTTLTSSGKTNTWVPIGDSLYLLNGTSATVERVEKADPNQPGSLRFIARVGDDVLFSQIGQSFVVGVARAKVVLDSSAVAWMGEEVVTFQTDGETYRNPLDNQPKTVMALNLNSSTSAVTDVDENTWIVDRDGIVHRLNGSEGAQSAELEDAAESVFLVNGDAFAVVDTTAVQLNGNRKLKMNGRPIPSIIETGGDLDAAWNSYLNGTKDSVNLSSSCVKNSIVLWGDSVYCRSSDGVVNLTDKLKPLPEGANMHIDSGYLWVYNEERVVAFDANGEAQASFSFKGVTVTGDGQTGADDESSTTSTTQPGLTPTTLPIPEDPGTLPPPEESVSSTIPASTSTDAPTPPPEDDSRPEATTEPPATAAPVPETPDEQCIGSDCLSKSVMFTWNVNNNRAVLRARLKEPYLRKCSSDVTTGNTSIGAILFDGSASSLSGSDQDVQFALSGDYAEVTLTICGLSNVVTTPIPVIPTPLLNLSWSDAGTKLNASLFPVDVWQAKSFTWSAGWSSASCSDSVELVTDDEQQNASSTFVPGNGAEGQIYCVRVVVVFALSFAISQSNTADANRDRPATDSAPPTTLPESSTTIVPESSTTIVPESSTTIVPETTTGSTSQSQGASGREVLDVIVVSRNRSLLEKEDFMLNIPQINERSAT
jgi:hypothetical protein